MKVVLFVDDEVNVIKGMMRMLNSAPGDYQYLFAGSGSEALDVLGHNQVHMVVSDIRMPGMDGAQLLERVMKLYPNTIRIILSGHSEIAMNLKAAGVAHQFLVKPCESEILLHTIEKSFYLRDFVHSEEMVRFITGLNALPSMSTSFRSLMKELNSKDPSLKRVGEIISEDLTMTAKVLQLVNSAFFGIPRRVGNARQAVTLLGINTLKALTLQIGLFSSVLTRSEDDVALADLLNHSLKVGSVAKAISQSENRDAKQAEAALIGGILHDIGKVLINMRPEYQKEPKSNHIQDPLARLNMEYRLFGTSHAEVGAYLLGLWGFADDVVEMVAFHHCPGRSRERDFSNLTAVHIANALVRGEEIEGGSEILLDYEYLKSINCLARADSWNEFYMKFSEGFQGQEGEND